MVGSEKMKSLENGERKQVGNFVDKFSAQRKAFKEQQPELFLCFVLFCFF